MPEKAESTSPPRCARRHTKSCDIGQLALVQASLGLALRDVYILIALFGVGSIICALWLPGKKATQAYGRANGRETIEDEGMAVMAAEL